MLSRTEGEAIVYPSCSADSTKLENCETGLVDLGATIWQQCICIVLLDLTAAEQIYLLMSCGTDTFIPIIRAVSLQAAIVELRDICFAHTDF